MTLWQIWAVCGVGFVILEMFTPSMFFLNFALAAFITSGLSFWVKDPYTLAIIFFVLSFVSFIFLRPILKKNFEKNKETGINSKYVGQIIPALQCPWSPNIIFMSMTTALIMWCKLD